MSTLIIAAPQLQWDPPGAVADLEKPVDLRLAPVRYGDGTPVPQDEMLQVGAFVYRSFNGAEDLWHEADRLWRAPPSSPAGLGDLQPLPLVFKAGQPLPWQGVLVAMGQNDGQGAARFAKATGGTPRYRLRAWARAKRAGVEHSALSDPSGDLLFASAAENQRFKLEFDTETPRDAQRVTLKLKTAALVSAGFIEIRAGGAHEVEIANCDAGGGVLARVRLAANGEIRLEPAAGQSVVVAGRLQAEVVARPNGVGGYVNL